MLSLQDEAWYNELLILEEKKLKILEEKSWKYLKKKAGNT